MIRPLLLVVCLAAALPLAAQARKTAPKPSAPAAAPKKEMAVPFTAGETLEYDIGWSSFVTAGTATVTVKDKKPSYGSLAYYIVAEGRPTPLVSKMYTLLYKADTLLDAYSLLPQRGSLYSEEGKRHRMKTTTFNQTAKKATYEVQTRTVVSKDLVIPGFTQDALSAIYVLRSIPFKSGERFNMPVADNGNVYKVQMQVGAVEPIKTPMGTINALKIVPLVTGPDKDAPRGLALWFSDDARRLPLRMEAQLLVGKFTVILRQVATQHQ
ncbi:MAG TPA: DUF3108 domain-containing protein [Vicinamibacterales bacterium]